MKILIAALLLFCFTVCYAATNDVFGKWTGQLVNDDGSLYPIHYTFTVTDSIVTGTAQSMLGTFSIDLGKLDTSNTFHFRVTINGVNIIHNGKFYGDLVGMSINLNGAVAHCTLVRSNT